MALQLACDALVISVTPAQLALGVPLQFSAGQLQSASLLVASSRSLVALAWHWLTCAVVHNVRV